MQKNGGTTVQYLCIVHIDPALMGQLSEEQGRALAQECRDYDQELSRRGHLIAAQALAGPESGKIVRMRSRKVSITDGPYAETKEFLGGFLFVEARDIEQAIEIAAGCPMARMGCIEVRPQLKVA